jgi:DNA ligase (NAD+)
LYALSENQIIQLERFAEKSAKNLIESIHSSKNIPFERVLFGLGIRHVGETVAKKLARHFRNLENLIHASFEELLEIDEIGDRIAESIISYFQNPQNIEIINRLKDAGLQFSISESTEATRSEKLKNLTIVISGTFQNHSRDELKELITLHGGKNTGSVTSSTNYFLAGENAGPAKLEKARKLNIPILSESDFIDMIS